MPKRNIELELRAEVDAKKYRELLKNLQKNARFISHTKRLSVMFFGIIEKHNFDIRVRVMNGQVEVVTKKGVYH